MAEVDTSSYPKPGLPVSPLDIAGKYGALQSQQLGINQQKLDQANQALGYMTRAMGSLGPSASKEEYAAVATNAAKMGLVPQDKLSIYMERLQAAPSAAAFYNEFTTAAMGHQEQINYHLGQRTDVNNGQQVTPAVTSVKPGFGVRAIGLPIQQQAPPTTPTFNANNQPQLLGAQAPQLPPGGEQAPTGIPGQTRMPVAQPGPITSPDIQGPSANFGGRVTGATIEQPTFAQRFDSSFPQARGAASGPTPMFEEGKKQLMEDQANAAQKMTAVKPAILALKILPGLRTGPGTESWNKAVAFLKANNIISTAQEGDPTVIYQEANKYLSQYLKGRGGRSDADLLAAEKSSPNVGIQLNPALTNLARTAVAQDRIEAARPTAFEGKNLADYGKHRATFPQSVDERAFSLDLMPPAESKKLVDQMHNEAFKNGVYKSTDAKVRNGEAKAGDPINPTAKSLKFFHSLDIAKKQGFFSGAEE